MLYEVITVKYRGVTVQQRPVNDVGMTDDPADVGRGPVDLAGFDAIEISHRPVERDGMPAVVAHDALGLARRTRRIQQVQRIGCLDRNAILSYNFV